MHNMVIRDVEVAGMAGLMTTNAYQEVSVMGVFTQVHIMLPRLPNINIDGMCMSLVTNLSRKFACL